MKFKAKLLSLPVAAAIIVIVGIVIGAVAAQRAFSELDHLQRVETPALGAAIRANLAVQRLRDTLKAAVAEASADKLIEAEKAAAEVSEVTGALRDLGVDTEDLSGTSAAYAKAALKVSRALVAQAAPGNDLQEMQTTSGELDKKLAAAIKSGLGGIDDRGRAASENARLNLLAGVVMGGAVLLALVVITVAVLRSVWRDLGADPAELRSMVELIGSGDLTTRLQAQPDAKDSVQAALTRMQHSLASVVSLVRENSESVATASAQIAQGNQDLSARTEEQSNALQQTAATMEQLNTTVKNNTGSAKQANQLAQGASEVASKGGAVVGQVVTTMQGISDSSRKIGDIIGVIDGIAFQTNILALNAAVEAARAGEQGRGFAVVASEVRSLAQRSAEAAKEIKSLIGRSVEQVEQGTALVDQAGNTMGEIVSSIKRVTDIVAEISSASQEQSAGISQVGDAVGQMDQVTQQNAALVEESAAAAESLRGQAQQLLQAVAVFKLSDQVTYIAAPAANAPTGKRRGPERTKNVSRPALMTKPAAEPAKSPEAIKMASAGATTDTDDWAAF